MHLRQPSSPRTGIATLQCLAWSADPKYPLHLGVGLASGVMLLTSFGSTSTVFFHSLATEGAVTNLLLTHATASCVSAAAATAGVLKEFVPRHRRPCSAIDWNPVHTNQVKYPYTVFVPRFH